GLLAIGAALMMPATLAILRHVFTDARERALAIGVWAAIASGGAALGPVVGGVLLEYFWWGSVFLINVPVVLALLWPAWRLVPAGQPAAHRPWDLGAAVLIMTALLGLVFGLKELGKPAPGYGVAMLAVAVGAVAMTLFARRQRGQAEPMIDVGMFRDAGFSRGVAVALIAMLTLVGVELVLSQRLQLVQGMTPLQAALLLLPVPLAAAAAGPLA
ncbi:MFS transporter, partial [Bordetella pertussis]